MASKAGSGFFHLFEWSKKSRKKLSANEISSFKESIQVKVDGEDDSLASQLHLIDEDEKSGVSSVRDNNDQICASSVTEEEGSRIWAPGVVARLMGLESMPTSGISEPHPTPLHESGTSQDKHNLHSSYFILRSAVNSRRIMELIPEKLPSTPIERFHVEALPPRLAKSISLTRHKLLSPVKNSGLTTEQITDLIVHKRSQCEIQSSKSSSGPLKDRDSRKIISSPLKTPKSFESLRGSVQSVTSKSSSSQALVRRKNALGNDKCLQGTNEIKRAAKEKGKSVSLAIQAKLNIQQREGSNTSTSNNTVPEEDEKCHRGRPFKFQAIDKINNQNKGFSGTDSSIHTHQQNKQNHLVSKKKLSKKPSVSNQIERKRVNRDVSSRKDTVVNDLPGRNKGSNVMTKGSETVATAKDRFILNNKKICKGGITEDGSYTKINGSVGNLPKNKHIQHNVVQGDHPRWTDDNLRHGADVVSFTFTSPLTKSVYKTQPLSSEDENTDRNNDHSFHHSGTTSASDNRTLPSVYLDMKGDKLGFLLELKLRELASRIQMSYSRPVKDDGTAAPITDSIGSTTSVDVPGVASSEYEGESLLQSSDDEVCCSNSNSSVTSSHMPCGDKHLEVHRTDCYSSVKDSKETNHQDQSPISILEKSFSNESCYSSESFENADGCRTDSSSYSVSEEIVDFDCMNKTFLVEPEIELCASSSHKQVADIDVASEIIRMNHIDTCWDEIDYVKEILNSSEIIFDDPISSLIDLTFEILDPLLFKKLEENRILLASELEEKLRRMRRKIIFDAVNECLTTRYSRYSRAGYRMWEKGTLLVGKNLAQELYSEISGWNGIVEDLMVDELVDKDMSTHLGKWIHFEVEAFGAGEEIERWLFDCLVDEIFDDFQVNCP